MNEFVPTLKKKSAFTVIRSFKFTKEEYAYLKESASKTKLPMTELIKQSVKFAMENFNKN